MYTFLLHYKVWEESRDFSVSNIALYFYDTPPSYRCTPTGCVRAKDNPNLAQRNQAFTIT